jgi:hypothetical protein
MILIIIAVYLALTFLLTVVGIERQMAGLQVFIISIFLTPIVGVFYVYINKNNTSKINYYHCSECNYIYPVKMSDCPICMEKGVKVKLKKYVSPFKVSEVVGVLNVAS